jgi:hypothetical protein
MKKIHIFYSHYNVEGKGLKFRPHWFDYEKCFINLLNTVQDKNVDIHVVMDGKIDNNWISKYKQYYVPHEIVGGNITNVTLGVYNIVKNLECDKNDLIYILENDYVHVDNWVDKVLDLFKTFDGLNYVSLYDHNDKYTWMHLYEDLVSKIFVTNTHHWRTVPNTCGSYICTKELFLEDYDVQTTVIGDANKWLHLEQTKGRFMLSALPGLSTHCMETLLSPTIDWENTINKSKL